VSRSRTTLSVYGSPSTAQVIPLGPGGVHRFGSESVRGLGSTVTAGTTSTGGYQVAASASVLVPTTGASAEGPYAITASSTANVAYL
jgi:hypothetical protein